MQIYSLLPVQPLNVVCTLCNVQLLAEPPTHGTHPPSQADSQSRQTASPASQPAAASQPASQPSRVAGTSAPGAAHRRRWPGDGPPCLQGAGKPHPRGAGRTVGRALNNLFCNEDPRFSGTRIYDGDKDALYTRHLDGVADMLHRCVRVFVADRRTVDAHALGHQPHAWLNPHLTFELETMTWIQFDTAYAYKATVGTGGASANSILKDDETL